MDEDLRDRLAAELAGLPEPPLGDLVDGALRQGKRLRLVRRARIAGASLAAMAVVIAGFLLHDRLTREIPTAASVPVLTTAPLSPAATWPSPAPVIEQPAGPTLPTTHAALFFRLRALLPGLVIVPVSSSPTHTLRFYLDRGHGFGMVFLQLETNDQIGGCQSAPDWSCGTGPNGVRTRVITNPTNCVQSTSVSVDHGNGVVVTLDVATCMPWNGTTNPPCQPALTTGEAIAIAADPSWGARMSAPLVEAANSEFSYLATP